jgi:branched-chain amino acid transport system permease protein
LNGISFGLLLFLLASGLTLIFGLMRIANIAHGSYYLLGAYVGLSVMRWTHAFPLAILVGGLAVAGIGILMQWWFLARFHQQTLAQVLLTMGFAFIFSDQALLLWGGDPQSVPIPASLSGTLHLGSVYFPAYRLFVIGLGVAVYGGLWMLLELTRRPSARRWMTRRWPGGSGSTSGVCSPACSRSARSSPPPAG